ncbi:MAG: 3-deoxy-D-manno-octulosonic acid transferase [Pseudomonadota bacterium]
MTTKPEPSSVHKPGASGFAWPLALYGAIARFPGPAIARWALTRRAKRGKEDASRLHERFGHPSLPRPQGEIIWLHAASVGESLSLLPLISGLRRTRPDLEILVTTGTLTSAKLMAERLPEGAAHQFAPVDTVEAVRRFLDYWRPSFLGVAESEMWPTLLTETHARGIPIVLLSARISATSARNWSWAPRSARRLFGSFDAVLAQSEEIADRLRRVEADPAKIHVAGALKEAATPLPVDKAELEALRAIVSARPRWLAASTHPGEEDPALDAHEMLASRHKRFLTMIAPRHPHRADAVAEMAEARGLRVKRRSDGDWPDDATDVYLIDTLGELGLWYRLSPLVFVGGSFAQVGGHNPLEPARLGTAILHGPNVHNFLDDYRRLKGEQAVQEIRMGETLGSALSELMTPEGEPNAHARQLAERAFEATLGGEQIVGRFLSHLDPLLPPPPVHAPGPLDNQSDARSPSGDMKVEDGDEAA